VFLASASFVYTGHYGLTPTGFSLAFAANAAGFFAATQLAAGLGEKFGAERVVATAVTGFVAVTLALVALVWSGVDHFALLVGMLICANACLGLVIPTAMVMALDEHGHNRGPRLIARRHAADAGRGAYDHACWSVLQRHPIADGRGYCDCRSAGLRGHAVHRELPAQGPAGGG
jgi:hypothetical protein